MSNEFLYIYPNSIQKRDGSAFCMAKTSEGNKLLVSGPDMELYEGDITTLQAVKYKCCPLTVENAKALRKLFDFTNPKSHRGHNITIGLGDRLGLASPAHIRLIRDLDIFPVLAQQSMRELNLTGRNYEEVLAAAVWAVFREGYTKGYGADGDHLKTYEEVKLALDCGYSMITLDCSEHIRNDMATASDDDISTSYANLTEDLASLENEYLQGRFHISADIDIEFTAADLKRAVLTYNDAIRHAVNIYSGLIKGTEIDFELSIDETLSTTSPQSHFFVANELVKQGVEMASLAPRFIGEFQKGIDYIGDLSEFERDFLVHAKIAEKFGYKISVHSGSDKFSIFPAVGRLTGGKYHIKTAGTNWLEAVRVIAKHEPDLYRELHTYALEHVSEAKKYYYITENTANIAALDSVSDEELPAYFDQNDARQVIHITYGLMLQAKTPEGTLRFRDSIYQALEKYESEYFEALEKHIGRHIAALGIEAGNY